MSSTPAVSPFYGEGADRLFTIYHDVTHEGSNRPTHDPHVAHSTQVVGKRNQRRGYRSKTPPRVPAHHSGPGPITPRAYMWPMPGGSCRCTKIGVPFCTPLLVRGQSQPHARGDAWRGRRSKDYQSHAQDKKHEELRGEVKLPRQGPCRGGLHGPGKSLAGATCPTPAEPPPLSLRVPTPLRHRNQGLGGASMVACRYL